MFYMDVRQIGYVQREDKSFIAELFQQPRSLHWENHLRKMVALAQASSNRTNSLFLPIPSTTCGCSGCTAVLLTTGTSSCLCFLDIEICLAILISAALATESLLWCCPRGKLLPDSMYGGFGGCAMGSWKSYSGSGLSALLSPPAFGRLRLDLRAGKARSMKVCFEELVLLLLLPLPELPSRGDLAGTAGGTKVRGLMGGNSETS